MFSMLAWRVAVKTGYQPAVAHRERVEKERDALLAKERETRHDAQSGERQSHAGQQSATRRRELSVTTPRAPTLRTRGGPETTMADPCGPAIGCVRGVRRVYCAGFARPT